MFLRIIFRFYFEFFMNNTGVRQHAVIQLLVLFVFGLMKKCLRRFFSDNQMLSFESGSLLAFSIQ